MPQRGFRIRGVLFDFDGTLTCPGALDFARIREALGCPPDLPILEYLEGLEDERLREVLHARLSELEAQAAAVSVPNRDAEAVVQHLKELGLRVGVITRNGREAVEKAMSAFERLTLQDFGVVVTRDVPVRPKPAEDGVLYAAERLGLSPHELLIVGDHLLDIEAGAAAGAVTVFLANRSGGRPPDRHTGAVASSRPGPAAPDFVIETLSELPEVVRLGRPLQVGKLPADLLARFFGSEAATATSGDLVWGPGIGEDVAVAAVREGIVALKSDPITFTAEDIARYAVIINANDMATSGAEPRWFLATVLLPVGTTGSEALRLLADLARECRQAGIALAGGHTEITDAVTRPVVSGSLVGTADRGQVLGKKGISPGDRVLMTKRLAVEGTAVLVAELRNEPALRGLKSEELERAAALGAGLSVTPEAALAAGHPGVTAMHDVTEGGLATALRELSVTAGRPVEADPSLAPRYPETDRLATVLGFDPLGLLGSGTLLITCRESAAGGLVRKLREAGIEATVLGRILDGLVESPAGLLVDPEGAPWPEFEVDEIARVLAEAGRPPPDESNGRQVPAR